MLLILSEAHIQKNLGFCKNWDTNTGVTFWGSLGFVRLIINYFLSSFY